MAAFRPAPGVECPFVKRALVLLAHGLALWAVLRAVAVLAGRLAPEPLAIALRAVAAPLAAAAVCAVYYGRFGSSSPLVTALAMAGAVACLDLSWAFLVERSLAGFRSPAGAWLPLALVFAQALASGIVERRSPPGAAP